MVLAALILIGSIMAGLGLVALLRRTAGESPYASEPGISGSVLEAISAPVAVLMAFVIFLAFEGFTRADEAAREEASAVLTLSRSASFFPESQADEIQGDLVCYARTVIEEEWPAMREGGESETVDKWLFETERAIQTLDIRTPAEREALAEFFAETNNRENARDQRLGEADGVVPGPVWIVLLLGGFTVVAYLAFLSDPRERFLAPAVMTGTLVAVIVSGLLLIAFFDHPYMDLPGAIDPTAMESAQERIQKEREADGRTTEPPCDSSGQPLPGTELVSG